MTPAPMPEPDLALRAAATRGTPDQVRAALAAGGRLDAADTSGCTPLILAAFCNADPDVARCLIESGASLQACTSDSGCTAMHGFASNGQPDLVALAVQGGGAVDLADQRGRSPLIIAVRHNHIRTAQALLRHGARADLQDNSGNAVLDCAASADIVRLLAAAGLDINRKRRDGHTALMKAASLPNLTVLQALLDGGADPAVRNDAGYTALHYARGAAAVQCLVAAGAPVQADDMAPLLVSRVVNDADPETFQALIAAGAPLEIPAVRSGRTALLAAADNGNEELFALLLAAGANPACRTPDGTGLDEMLEWRPSIRTIYKSWRARQAMRLVLGTTAGVRGAAP